MDNHATLDMVRIIERHARAAFDEIIAALEGPQTGDREPSPALLAVVTAPPAAADAESPAVTWRQIGDPRIGETQGWPDGTIDTYGDFFVYRGSGPFAHLTVALGYVTTAGKKNEVVGFVMGSGGGSKRPLTVFFAADDYDHTGERLSMIRGKGGGRSRKAYGIGDALPPDYDGFKIDILGSRIEGKWNVKAVVAHKDDLDAMLTHTALQATLRGIA